MRKFTQVGLCSLQKVTCLRTEFMTIGQYVIQINCQSYNRSKIPSVNQYFPHRTNVTQFLLAITPMIQQTQLCKLKVGGTQFGNRWQRQIRELVALSISVDTSPVLYGVLQVQCWQLPNTLSELHQFALLVYLLVLHTGRNQNKKRLKIKPMYNQILSYT